MPRFTAAQLAAVVGANLEGGPERTFLRPAPIADARWSEIALALDDEASTGAGGLVVAEDWQGEIGERAILRTHSPQEAFNQIVAIFAEARESFAIHPLASVSRDALIADGVAIGPYAVVEPGAQIGPGTRIEANVVIGADATIGADCEIRSGASISPRASLGDRVVIHEGAAIGADGSGYMEQHGGLVARPRFGTVAIGGEAQIGPNSVVERGIEQTTTVGSNTMVGPLVIIAHDTVVGANCVIGAQSGVASDVTVGDWAIIDVKCGIGHGTRIEAGARVGPFSRVAGTVPAGQRVLGYPARPWRKTLRNWAAEGRMGELLDRVRKLESKLLGREDT